MTPNLTAETIIELTRDIWSALLADQGGLITGGDVRARPGAGALGEVAGQVAGEAAGELSATVDISGAWNGTACLSCSTLAGRHAASAMFDMDLDELSQDEVADAVGELINVVGGNIKSLLPGPTELSLPTFHDQGMFKVPGDLELAQEVRFTWMDEPVMVRVWTAAPA